MSPVVASYLASLGFLLSSASVRPVTAPPWGRSLTYQPIAATMNAVEPSPPPKPLPMPPVLEQWGCDKALWTSIKQKSGLIKLANAGDEAHARKRLSKLRELIADAPEPSAETVARKAWLEQGKPSTKRKRPPKRKDGPYEKFGRIPRRLGADIDLEAVSSMVEERAACKRTQDYERADELRLKLKSLGGEEGWGITIRDDTRTWYVTKTKDAAPPKRGEIAKAKKQEARAREEVAVKKRADQKAIEREWGLEKKAKLKRRQAGAAKARAAAPKTDAVKQVLDKAQKTRGKKATGAKAGASPRVKAKVTTVTLPETITVGELASALNVGAAKVVEDLMKMGVLASMAQSIDADTAEKIALGCGATKVTRARKRKRAPTTSEAAAPAAAAGESRGGEDIKGSKKGAKERIFTVGEDGSFVPNPAAPDGFEWGATF